MWACDGVSVAALNMSLTGFPTGRPSPSPSLILTLIRKQLIPYTQRVRDSVVVGFRWIT